MRSMRFAHGPRRIDLNSSNKLTLQGVPIPASLFGGSLSTPLIQHLDLDESWNIAQLDDLAPDSSQVRPTTPDLIAGANDDKADFLLPPAEERLVGRCPNVVCGLTRWSVLRTSPCIPCIGCRLAPPERPCECNLGCTSFHPGNYFPKTNANRTRLHWLLHFYNVTKRRTPANSLLGIRPT